MTPYKHQKSAILLKLINLINPTTGLDAEVATKVQLDLAKFYNTVLLLLLYDALKRFMHLRSYQVDCRTVEVVLSLTSG
ncbi:MAG: hypothetical protein RLZZ74_1505 [Cyanobacteriota bacterium]|jgi:hypothetical protein